MFKLTRYVGSRFPRFKKFMMPMWRLFTHTNWIARNTLTRHRPLIIPVAPGVSVLLHPIGQIAEVMWWSGDFEQNEREFLGLYIRPGMKVVNIGANIGLYAVIASSLVGATGEVHAFEPSPQTFDWLNNNVDLNDCKNVRTLRLALSDKKGKAMLRADPKNVHADGHRFVQEIADVRGGMLSTDEVVECGTLDEYMQSLSGSEISPIDVMIIDVEGAELSVLRGGLQAMLASPNLLLLLECTVNHDEVERMLVDLEFEFFTWDIKNKILQPALFKDAALVGDVIAKRGNIVF